MSLCGESKSAGLPLVGLLHEPGIQVEHFAHANVAVRESNVENERRDLATFCDRWKKWPPSDAPTARATEGTEKDYYDASQAVEKFGPLRA